MLLDNLHVQVTIGFAAGEVFPKAFEGMLNPPHTNFKLKMAHSHLYNRCTADASQRCTFMAMTVCVASCLLLAASLVLIKGAARLDKSGETFIQLQP